MKTLITLNIGLLDTDGLAVNVHTAIFHLLSILKIDILASRVGKGKWEGNNEPVLVVSSHVIFDETFENKLVELAQSLRQSCIAVRFLDGTGRLYPAIYPFDNSQFVELEKQHEKVLIEFSYDQEKWKPIFHNPTLFKNRRDAEFEIEQLRRDAAQSRHKKAFYRIVQANS